MVSAVASFRVQVSHICCAPFRAISNKICALAEAFFGYILRIVTFQLGEIQTPGARWIIRMYQHLNSDPRETRPYDPARLARSKQLLAAFGGAEASLYPADGQATVDCMLLKSSDVFRHLAELGAQCVDFTYKGRPRKALLNPPDILNEFSLRLPKVPVLRPDGATVEGLLLPIASPPNEQPRLVIPCHSPGRAWAMNRTEHLRNALAGHDVLAWDPRGTAESTGTPSEGGYYLDMEAVCEYAFFQGYPPEEIYLHGFCKGAACAAHAKKKYHHLGINAILSNPYTSMKEVVENYGWLGRLAARFGLKAIQSTDPAITSRVNQDYFNNVAKLRNLPRSNGKLIIIHTPATDKMMPYATAARLLYAFDDAGPSSEIVHFHPDPKVNGHMLPPDETRYVQWRMYREIT